MIIGKISSKFILCDPLLNSGDQAVLVKHLYYKEKFDADQS